jgi:dihydrofolate reductase
VLTHRADFVADGATVVQSLDDALTDPDTWVIGGEQIYTLAMPRAHRCEVTEIDINLPRDDGDAVAPVLDETWVGTPGEWQVSRAGLRYRVHSYYRA